MFVLISSWKCGEAIRPYLYDVPIGFIILLSSDVESFIDFDLFEFLTGLSIHNHEQVIENKHNDCFHLFLLYHEEIELVHEFPFRSEDGVVFGSKFLFEVVESISSDDFIHFVVYFLKIGSELFPSLYHPIVVGMDRVGFFYDAVKVCLILSYSEGWLFEGTDSSDLFFIVEFVADLAHLLIFFF